MRHVVVFFFYAVLSVLFHLSWQMAPFVTFVQFVCLFACALLVPPSLRFMSGYAWFAMTQLITSLAVFALQFRNLNVMFSLANVFLCISTILCLVYAKFRRGENPTTYAIEAENKSKRESRVSVTSCLDSNCSGHVRLVEVFVVMVLVLSLSVLVKSSLGQTFHLDDDAHVMELLKAKFTNYESMI